MHICMRDETICFKQRLKKYAIDLELFALLHVHFGMSYVYRGRLFYKIDKHKEPGTAFWPIVHHDNIAPGFWTKKMNLQELNKYLRSLLTNYGLT